MWKILGLRRSKCSNPDGPRTEKSGPGGFQKISDFLEKIRYPPERIPEKAEEIWREWLGTGHWWEPSEREILWSTGDLTERRITETEKEIIEEYGSLYILTRYELQGEPNARPVSYQVWDKEDNPLIPIDIQPRTEESASA